MKKRALAETHGDRRGNGDAKDEGGEAESIEPAEELLVACDVSEVGQHDAAAHGQSCEVEGGNEEEDDPGAIAEEVFQVLGEVGLLLRIGLDALFGREESDDEEEHAEDGQQAHGDLVTARVVAAAEEDNHGDRRLCTMKPAELAKIWR